jgi:ribulose-5-phosphate 4-epimerase/fuculose-1-phosphate aldolase
MNSAIEDLVAAYRILADQQVLDGYGHVSIRSPSNPERYFLSRSLAPELVTAADIMEFDFDSQPVDGQSRALYSERFIHGEIYRSRPDVGAVVHNHSPSLIPFGCTEVGLRPMYHMSAFIADGIPVFDIADVQADSDMLVRTPQLGRALAQCLGPSPAALMRGHGSVVVADNLAHAVGRSVYLEMNARLQTQALMLAGEARRVKYLSSGEAKAAAPTMQSYSRAWDLWRAKVL